MPSGEATIAVLEWWRDGRAAFNAQQGKRKGDGSDSDEEDELVDDSPTKGLAARHMRKMMPTNLTPIPFKFSPKV